MAFGQRIQAHRRYRQHFDKAEKYAVFIAAYAQYLTRFEVRLTGIPNGDGFTPGQNVLLKAAERKLFHGSF